MRLELDVGARELVLSAAGRLLAREAFDGLAASPASSLLPALQRLAPSRPSGRLVARVAAVHARLLLLPWMEQLSSAERWNSLAASRFEQVYGESTAPGWVLRIADDAPPRPRLAAALPAPLLDALQSALQPGEVRIDLLDSLGELLAGEPEFSGCVARVRDDVALLMMLWRGELRRVRARRRDASGIADLAATARSEWAAARPDGAAEAGRGARGRPQPQLAVAVDVAEAGPPLASALECSRVVVLPRACPAGAARH